MSLLFFETKNLLSLEKQKQNFAFILLAFVRYHILRFNPLSANPAKWSDTLKQFIGKLPTNCLSVFDHFMKLMLKGLMAV